MNDATGTDFMVITYGHKRISIIWNREANTARILPVIIAIIQPEEIRKSEKIIVLKNPSSSQIVQSLTATFTGEAKSISMPTATEIMCQSTRAKNMLTAF